MDFLTDSISLRVTYNKMKSLFSQSALVFLQFWVFEAIFEAREQNLPILKTLFVPFIVLKTTVSISRFQHKNWLEERATLC